MKADIHPDGTLRIKPESMTEQVALKAWWDRSRVDFAGCPANVTGIKVGALVPMAHKPKESGT